MTKCQSITINYYSRNHEGANGKKILWFQPMQNYITRKPLKIKVVVLV